MVPGRGHSAYKVKGKGWDGAEQYSYMTVVGQDMSTKDIPQRPASSSQASPLKRKIH